MIKREYMVMYSAREGGEPVHLITIRGARELRCHCDLGVKVLRDRVRSLASPKVSCKTCQDEIDKWEEFWARQDERMHR